jgi:hypothetical protein
MINITYLRSGRLLISDTQVKDFKILEKKIQETIEQNNSKRKIDYLKMSNAMKHLLK